MGSASMASPDFVVTFTFFLLLYLAFHSSEATHPECELSTIHCENEKLMIKSHIGKYEIKSVSEDNNTILVHDVQLSGSLSSGNCSGLFNLQDPIFHTFFKFKTPNLTFFKCNKLHTPPPPGPDYPGIHPYPHCNDYDLFYYNKSEHGLPPEDQLASFDCSKFDYPVLPPVDGNWDLLVPVLERGFFLELKYPSECHDDCQATCRREWNGALNKCAGGKKKLGLNLIGIVASATVIGITMTAVYLMCCWRSKFSSNILIFFFKKETKNDHDVEAFFKNYGSFTPERYRYSDVKKMTDFFKEKLGQGGYGSVYKGKLLDNQLVAVKVLSEFKGNGEEFVNEVATISRTSHVNIVTLIGFCFEGRKRALIYEFMPNGSLEKFIYDKKSLEAHLILGWERLYRIAIGIARGLEYLHRGCNTRILHFDIKPHNILLDQEFCPKISDFGLAKLCPNKESIVSMLGARGTVGYIAPEVFSRSFGGVSHKSDVYSYGMMVLEMVGGRRNVDVGVDRTSEIYFPHWIYNRLKLDGDLGLHGLITGEEEEIARKMTLVGLWCIQTDPLNRPSINKVVEMLEGSLDSLQIPPKPYLSSPSRSPEGSPTTWENSLITSVL